LTKIVATYTYTFEGMPVYELVDGPGGTKVKQEKYSDEEPVKREPTTVIGEVVTSQNADKYTINYYQPVDYSNEEEIRDKVNEFIQTRRGQSEESSEIIDNTNFDEELKTYVKSLLDEEAAKYFTEKNPGIDEPKVEIKVDLMQISDSPDWKRFKD